MGVQDGEVRAASAADWGGLLPLHHHEPGASQQIVAVRVHSLTRPQDLLGRLAVPPAMRGSVTVPAFSELARDTPAQLAVQVVEEVLLPLFVLLRRHLPLPHFRLICPYVRLLGPFGSGALPQIAGGRLLSTTLEIDLAVLPDAGHLEFPGELFGDGLPFFTQRFYQALFNEIVRLEDNIAGFQLHSPHRGQVR